MSIWNSLIVLVLVSASYSIAFLGDGTVRRLTVEDGAVETVGAQSDRRVLKADVARLLSQD